MQFSLLMKLSGDTDVGIEVEHVNNSVNLVANVVLLRRTVPITNESAVV